MTIDDFNNSAKNYKSEKLKVGLETLGSIARDFTIGGLPLPGPMDDLVGVGMNLYGGYNAWKEIDEEYNDNWERALMVVGGTYVQYGPNGNGYRLNTYSARSADVALRNAQVKVNGYSVYTYDIKDTNGEVLEGYSANEINESISDALRNAAKDGIIDNEALKGYDKKEYAKMYFAFTGQNIEGLVDDDGNEIIITWDDISAADLIGSDGAGGYLEIYQTIDPGYPFDTDNNDDQMVDYSPASDIMGTGNGYDDQED